MKVTIDENLKGKDLFSFLSANKATLIAQKKYELKKGDGVSYSQHLVNQKGDIVKAATAMEEDVNSLRVVTVINTTFWYDSHKDVHIDGLWKKSLSETKDLYLLQEHDMSFKGIITDEIKAYTQKIPWRSLGVEMDGATEALVFDNKIAKSRNEYMFGEYRKGHVKNHSVGMRYVDIRLAFNAEDYKEEFALWNKYIGRIANRQEVEEEGYFFAVMEAKVIEGSAVPVGSNRITPTMSVTDSTKGQPEHPTDQLPHHEETFDWRSAIKQTNIIKN